MNIFRTPSLISESAGSLAALVCDPTPRDAQQRSAMKLKATYETEIYETEAGYIAISQADPSGGDDSLVLLSPEQAEAIAQELIRLAASVDFYASEEEQN